MAFEEPAAPTGPGAIDTTEVVGRRIGAILIDSILLFVVFLVVGLATGGGHASGSSASIRLGSGSTLLYFAIVLAYYVVCEGTNGQTLGKRLLRIRVVSQDGGRASWGQVLGRNLLRIVDVLPVVYIVGLITILATGEGRRQRVGDLAAHTLVVPA